MKIVSSGTRHKVTHTQDETNRVRTACGETLPYTEDALSLHAAKRICLGCYYWEGSMAETAANMGISVEDLKERIRVIKGSKRRPEQSTTKASSYTMPLDDVDHYRHGWVGYSAMEGSFNAPTNKRTGRKMTLEELDEL